MNDVIIVGAGGFGREVHLWAKDALSPKEYRFKGFLDDDFETKTRLESGMTILGSIAPGRLQYEIAENDRFIFAIGGTERKKQIIERLQERGARFLTLVHPKAIVARSATVGEGTIVCPFSLVSDRVELGAFVLVNFYASCGHDAKVGNYSILSPYATVNGFGELAEEVFMGTHSTVAPGCRVGQKSKINANSVAMKDIPPSSLVYGVPGKVATIFDFKSSMSS